MGVPQTQSHEIHEVTKCSWGCICYLISRAFPTCLCRNSSAVDGNNDVTKEKLSDLSRLGPGTVEDGV